MGEKEVFQWTGKNRRQFTAEFKIEAVRLVEQEGRSNAGVARELGIRPDMLRNWRRAAQGKGGLRKAEDVFPGHGRLPSAEEEIRRLRCEVEILRQEREILKKAAAFFARELR